MIGLRTAGLLAAALMVSGCMSEWFGEEEKVSLKGQTIEDVQAAEDLAFYDGDLYVANRGEAPGIAVIDTGTGKIIDFYARRLAPWRMAFGTNGTLMVSYTDFDRFSLGWIDVTEKKSHDAGGTNGALVEPVFTGNEFYRMDQYLGSGTYKVGRLALSGGENGLTDALSLQRTPSALVAAGSKLYLASSQSRFLLRLNKNSVSAQGRDSVDIARPGSTDSTGFDTHIGALAAWNGFVFAAVSRYGGPDSSYVAVIDTASGNVVKFVSLRFKTPLHGSVRNGIWYLSSPGWDVGGFQPDGGVEAFDLTSQTLGGVVVTEGGLGGAVAGFVPVNDHSGYVVISSGVEGNVKRLRKIFF